MTGEPLEERVLTVPEAAALLRISPRSFYAAAARGEVPVRRIGRRVVVPGAALCRWLKGEPGDGAAGGEVRPRS